MENQFYVALLPKRETKILGLKIFIFNVENRFGKAEAPKSLVDLILGGQQL
jgi:hypothetical protein